jgi:hypothetical protein
MAAHGACCRSSVQGIPHTVEKRRKRSALHDPAAHSNGRVMDLVVSDKALFDDWSR